MGRRTSVRYVTNPATGQTGRTGVDRDASTDAITRAWNNAPPETFRVRWTGFLVVTQPGVYTFATSSDDGSAVAIDGERVVDNTGDHGLVTKTGRVQLGRGPHLVLVDYLQAGGLYAMTWSWGARTLPCRRYPRGRCGHGAPASGERTPFASSIRCS